MSFLAANDPDCFNCTDAVELTITPKEKDLGEMVVRRVLPAPERRLVGPFIFFDHMGPAEFPPGQGIAVRPHPHIGLATITYLFEGEIMHRDSLGYAQPIEPGAVNLMTAGKGIVHSERAGRDFDQHARLHGIQSWIALPEVLQECEPAFEHTPATALPQLQTAGCDITVIMGEAFGARSPVTCHSPTLYLECLLPAGATLGLPTGMPEMAAYVVTGSIEVGAEAIPAGVMAVFRGDVALRCTADARVMVIGGEPLGERHIWWNFVSTSRQRIEQGKADWQAGRFAMVEGDDEFIPLPE